MAIFIMQVDYCIYILVTFWKLVYSKDQSWEASKNSKDQYIKFKNILSRGSHYNTLMSLLGYFSVFFFLMKNNQK